MSTVNIPVENSLAIRCFRSLVRHGLRPLLGPTERLAHQRKIVSLACRTGKLPRGTRIERIDNASVRGEWVVPANASAGRFVLYLHGGGFQLGDPASHRELVARLANEAAARALVVDYRLAPEHRYPAALDDCLGALGWLQDNGAEPERIAVCGDSAGGWLALSLVQRCLAEGQAAPACVYCISPLTDATRSGPSYQTVGDADPLLRLDWLATLFPLFAPDHDPSSPELSPLRGDFAGFPPILVQVGEQEVLLDDAVRLEERAVSMGADCRLEIWRNLWHVFQLLGTYLPSARQALREAGQFIRHRIP